MRIPPLFLGIGSVLLTVAIGLWAWSQRVLAVREAYATGSMIGIAGVVFFCPALSFLIVGAVYAWRERVVAH